jgi:hypothetical protein
VTSSRAMIFRIAAIVLAAAPLAPTAVAACPLCHGETGQRVRAGIFGEDFTANVLASLLPFPIFLGIVAAIHGRPAGGRDTRPPAPRSQSTSEAR